MKNAIVLTGYSGAGKDTIASSLISNHCDLVNVKMSALTKDIFAKAFRVPREWLDGTDKEPHWREQDLTNGYGISCLDLLSVLFHGAKASPKLFNANVKYALDSIGEDKTPVFTDVRRAEELEAIKARFQTHIFFISRTNVYPGISDGNIVDMIENEDINVVYNYSTVDVAVRVIERVLKFKGVDLGFSKPTLKIFKSLSDITENPGELYEPISKTLTKLIKCLKDGGFSGESLQSVFEQVLKFAAEDIHTVKLTEISGDSYMIYNETVRILLPRLREIANVKLVGFQEEII